MDKNSSTRVNDLFKTVWKKKILPRIRYVRAITVALYCILHTRMDEKKNKIRVSVNTVFGGWSKKKRREVKKKTRPKYSY